MNKFEPLQTGHRPEIEPFRAMEVLKRANALKRDGADVISLAVGQPGARLPEPMREAIARFGDQGAFGYTDALGINALREALADYHNKKYEDCVLPEQIAITNGASGGFTLAFLASLVPGARIGIAVPGYPAYRNIIRALGFQPVEIRVERETRWCLTADLIRDAHRTAPLQAVLVASPANPTGTMMSAAMLEEAVEACADLGIRFISDEIYHGLSYEMEEATARAMGQADAIVINSFSKYFCMTGWRVGWMVLPRDLIGPVERLAQNMFICAPDLSQNLALCALGQTAYFDTLREDYAQNRVALMERLPQLGFDGTLPIDGAFYAYVPVGRFSDNASDFARRMLEDIHVAATPGIDFDTAEGNTMLRLSFAGTASDISIALDRLAGWLPSLSA